ncbi:MAG: bifunctional riboflavin kinase/FAD synthetase [Rhodospirillales bacterium]
MRIFRHRDDLKAAGDSLRGGAVAIGNFDGVHLGHRKVIGEAGQIAKAQGIPWSVLTFEPHPRSLFQADAKPFRLTPFRTKARLIEEMGVEVLMVQAFDRDFSQLSAEAFVEQVLVDGLNARHVVAGYDFYFGKGRSGNCDTLLHQGRDRGFGFTAVSAQGDGEVYSSSRVRACLTNGDVRQATAVLGRPFEFAGRVTHGDKRGRTIGFPTANLALGSYLRPKNGVYAIRAALDETEGGSRLAEDAWMAGVANLGHRPTFPSEDVILEVHLFDRSLDLYDRHLRVELIDYIREERKFDGLDALKAQIAADCEAACRIFSA